MPAGSGDAVAGHDSFLDPLVLFQDDYFVAVAKAGGIGVHRRAGCAEVPLLQRLRRQLGRRVYPVHRLDRAASGVVVFGLSSAAASRLCGLFAARAVEKVYWAVVRGHVAESGVIDHPLAREPQKPVRAAVTEYRRLACTTLPFAVGRYQTARYSLVEVRPLTGRHHQIRRHFAHISHPIVGDTVHGDGRHNRFFREHFDLHRLLLMARRLRFRHPFHDRDILLEAPLEETLGRCLARLWPDLC